MSVVYSIAGHNIENFGENPRESRVSIQEGRDNNKSLGQRTSTRQSVLKKQPKFADQAELVESKYEEDFENEISKEKIEGTDKDLFYEPTDLGEEYFNILQQKYKEQNKLLTNDPKLLYNYWKQLKKKNETQKPPKYTARITDDMSDSQVKKIAELMEQREQQQKQIDTILSSNPQDVEYTLKIHSTESKKEITMSEFFVKRAKEIEREKQIEERKKKKQDMQQRQISQQRLYSGKQKPEEYEEDRKKREKEEKKIEQQKAKDIEYQQKINKEKAYNERTEFVNKIIQAHQNLKPNVKDYRTQEKLYDFYFGLTPEEREKSGFSEQEDKQQQEVKEILNLYFKERAKDFKNVHVMKQGYDTDKIDDIVRVWHNKTTPLEKQKFALDFEDEGNVRECLTKYNEFVEEEKKQEQERQEMLQKEEEEKRQEKVKKIQQNHEKKSKLLAKPKDRLRLGKNILLLKKAFPDDKFLRRILLQEFRDTRLAKMPEEYDVYDSDEENAIKERREIPKHITLKTLEKPDKDKELEIRQMFDKMLEKYKREKDQKLAKDEQTSKQQRDNDRAMDAFLSKKAKEFIVWRQKRFDEMEQDDAEDDEYEMDHETSKGKVDNNQEKTKTLKNFLSKIYKEMLATESLKEATQRNFPYLKYGESKNLKQRSFPTSFKRRFFVAVKQYLREQYGAGKKDKHNKLPFWAPGGDGARCRIHDKIDCPSDCKFVTSNKKIFDLMGNIVARKKWERAMYMNEKLIEKAEQSKNEADVKYYKDQREQLKLKFQRKNNSAWVDEKYLGERKQVLLTFSDAEHCTFMPDVRVQGEERTFEQWVDDWGENLKKKQPRIFKLGVLKQCNILISKGKYLEAYSKLRETFNIEDIKEHFDNENGKEYKMISKDSMYIKGKEDPVEVRKNMKNENFENAKNQPVLLDVYNMVTFLENYEKQIIKAKAETKKMVAQDPFAPQNPLLSKSLNMSQHKDLDNNKSTMSINSAFTTYATRRQTVKSFMCPLGKKCPRVLEGRWPQSEIASIVPLGAQCEFAHTYAELKFEQELKSKKHMLQNYIGKLEGLKNPEFKYWNPAGANFEQCKGCGFKCAICRLRQANMAKLQKFLDKKKGDQAFLKETQQKQQDKDKQQKNDEDNDKGDVKMKKSSGNMAVQLKKKDKVRYMKLQKKEERSEEINKQKKVNEEKYNKKVGALQKANTLYTQERYSEAFKVICRAIEIVKQELEEKVQEDKKEDEHWKCVLGLSAEEEITPELVYQTLNNNLDEGEEENQNNGQILYFYAQKRGIIGQKKPDVNQFLNIQIEESYLKIEKKLTDKEKDIILMKIKIEKLEGEEDLETTVDSKRSSKKDVDHKNLCPNIKEMGHCPDFEREKQQHVWQHQGWGDLQGKDIERKCKFAHIPQDIYLEKTEQKINNLNKSIHKTQDEIVNSTKPQPYKPPSAQTVIMSVNEWRDKERERELGKATKNQKKNTIDKAHRDVIWDRELEDLVQPVHERPKKQM